MIIAYCLSHNKAIRFVNADGYMSTGQGIIGHNMFAYCGNNPINFADYNGNFFKKIGKVIHNVAKAVVDVVTGVHDAVKKGLPWKPATDSAYGFYGMKTIGDEVGIHNKNAEIHTQNVYQIGRNESTKAVSFVGTLTQDENYVAKCKTTYIHMEGYLEIDHPDIFDDDATWSTLDEKQKNIIINQMQVWDYNKYKEMFMNSASNAISKGVGIVY